MTHLLALRTRARAAGVVHDFTSFAIVALLVCAPATVRAQRMPDIQGPIHKAENARAAEEKHLSEETGQALPDRKPRNGFAPSSGPGSTPSNGVPATAMPANAQPARSTATVAPGPMQPVTRELFTYEPQGRRDPFYSLILTEELRPLLSDLKLVGILYASSGRGSVAIMRDVLTNAQYRVNAGQTLGRMRVAQIKPRAVIFTIDEFGLSRQDSLFLVDSTKVRIR